MDAKAAKFFKEVLSKTLAGKLRWEPTAVESNYIAAVGGHFTLSITETENTFPIQYELVLRDRDGRELMGVTHAEAGVPQTAFRELYVNARRQALNVDEKIESVIGELSKL